MGSIPPTWSADSNGTGVLRLLRFKYFLIKRLGGGGALCKGLSDHPPVHLEYPGILTYETKKVVFLPLTVLGGGEGLQPLSHQDPKAQGAK